LGHALGASSLASNLLGAEQRANPRKRHDSRPSTASEPLERERPHPPYANSVVQRRSIQASKLRFVNGYGEKGQLLSNLTSLASTGTPALSSSHLTGILDGVVRIS